ncbi:MAG: hypothetical protein KDA77_00250 [Planctomycetaceae bacterium]|nr:hypothetical protein [Planctomycetaceae bacterium]
MTDEAGEKILKELSQIRENLTRIDCKMDHVNDSCGRHQVWLQDIERELGGSPGKPGMRTEVHELKIAQQSQIWYWRAAVAAFFTSAAAWVIQLFGGQK